jgi:oligopeptide/dipeptide ABC transporter ATP-binding protein
MTEPILKVNHLTVVFHGDRKRLTAVDDLSFELFPGEVFGIIGESGSGKSVTCRSIMRLIQYPGEIISGNIHYKNDDLLEISNKEIHRFRGREIAMIFQDAMVALNPVKRVKDQIIETYKENGVAVKDNQYENAAIDLLRSVGISSPETRINDYPFQFSGGMAQRVVIAIALAPNPSILLADEPTSALDVTIQHQILKLLLNLQKERNMSMVLVTHSFGIVAQTCDRVGVMYAGQFVEIGDINTIFTYPRHPYTIGLLNCVPDVDSPMLQPLKPISGMVPDLYHVPKGCRFHPRCPIAAEECKTSEIPFIEVSIGHTSRCIFHDQLEKSTDIYRY